MLSGVGESPTARHPMFEIVADVKSPSGEVERVSSQQKLNTLSHLWRPPDPGDVVSARWDPADRTLRLDLGGDGRYDEKVIKALGRTRHASPGLLESAVARAKTKHTVTGRFHIWLGPAAERVLLIDQAGRLQAAGSPTARVGVFPGRGRPRCRRRSPG